MTESDASGRPSNERDGACICDYNPSTTDGPQEDCPFHGRPYAYWIERGDALADRLAAVSALADDLTREIGELRTDVPPVGPSRVAHVYRTAGLGEARDRLLAALAPVTSPEKIDSARG
jgi:hypothetical protein